MPINQDSDKIKEYLSAITKVFNYQKSGYFAAYRTAMWSHDPTAGKAKAFGKLTRMLYLVGLDAIPSSYANESGLLTLTHQALTEVAPDTGETEIKNRLYNENGSLNMVNLMQKMLTQEDDQLAPIERLKKVINMLHEIFSLLAPFYEKKDLKLLKSGIHAFVREIQGLVTTDEEAKAFESRIFDIQKLKNKLEKQQVELNLLKERQGEAKRLLEEVIDPGRIRQALSLPERLNVLYKKIKEDIQVAEREVEGRFNMFGYSITGDVNLKKLKELKELLNHVLRVDKPELRPETLVALQEIARSKLLELFQKDKEVNDQLKTLLTQLEHVNRLIYSNISSSQSAEKLQIYYVIPREATAVIDGSKLDPLTDHDARKKKKKTKKHLGWGAKIISAIVAIGQGMIPMAFAIGPAGLPMAIAIGVAGTLCSYFLFKGDSYNVLKNIRFITFFKGKDGRSLPKEKKRWVRVGLFFAALSAITSGLLAFGSTQAGVVTLCTLLGIASGPAAPLVVAVIIGSLTTFALGAVFTQIVTTWIHEDTIQKMLRKLTWNNLKNYFTAPSDATAKQKIEHVIYQTIRAFLLPAAALAAITVSIVAVGMFTSQSVAVFTNIDKAVQLSNKAALILTTTVGTLINALNVIFYLKAIFYIKSVVQAGALGLYRFCRNPVNTTKATVAWLAGKISSTEPTRPTMPLKNNRARTIGENIRMFERGMSTFWKGMLLGAIGLNGYGNGDGANNVLSRNMLDSAVAPLLGGNKTLALAVANKSFMMGSIGCNMKPAMETLATTNTVVPDRNDAMIREARLPTTATQDASSQAVLVFSDDRASTIDSIDATSRGALSQQSIFADRSRSSSSSSQAAPVDTTSQTGTLSNASVITLLGSRQSVFPAAEASNASQLAQAHYPADDFSIA